MIHEHDCGFYIKHISDVLQRDSNNALRAKDLTLAQVTVLLLLESSPNGETSLKELEKQLQVAQSTAAGIIVRLEHKGFVEGYGSSEDKRVKMVRITEAGRACCADSHANMKQAEERLLSSLTETERILLAALLEKVSDSM
ncbi:MAG: MarR family winged helix-turn-helix transcriptional regulator [Faecousia sp.]